MRLFRITKNEYLHDLSGEGAKRAGGRWNSKGVPVLYTASSLSLALLETLAHTPIHIIPDGMGYVIIECPDPGPGAALASFDTQALPADWKSQASPPPELKTIGDSWAKSGNHLYLRVPSVIVELEYNWILNPAHPAFKDVRIVGQGPVPLDSRVAQNIRA